jgi:hypothetical protein
MESKPFKRSRISDACSNCGTERYPQYRRGYCEDCYRLVLKKEKISRWEPQNFSELQWDWPTGLEFGDLFTQIGPGIDAWKSHIPRVRAGRIEKIDERLQLLKTLEFQRSQNVNGFLIQRKLRRLAEHAGVRDPSVLPGITNEAEREFDPRQRQILCRWILDIEERVTVRKRRRPPR